VKLSSGLGVLKSVKSDASRILWPTWATWALVAVVISGIVTIVATIKDIW
jgi:hypothetical protein